MVCYTTCAFAVAFIVASIYIMLSSRNSNKEIVGIDQDVYDKIVNTRIKIYIIASIAGAILGLIYLFTMRGKVSTFPLICTAVLIFFLVQLVVYMVYPKSDYLLNYVTNNEQSKQWLEMYNSMMKKFWIGFFIGLVGYGILCLAFLR